MIFFFQLKNPVNFNEHLLPVCLPPPGRELVPGMNCTVIGWGKSEDHEGEDKILLKCFPTHDIKYFWQICFSESIHFMF